MSVRMGELGSHWKDFREIWHLKFYRISVEKIQVSLQSDRNNGYFTWRLCTFMMTYHWLLLEMKKYLKENCREIQNIFHVKIVPFMGWRGKISQSRAGHGWPYNTEHAHCMLYIEDYRHTLRICNTYWFYTATVATKTLLNITLCVRCLCLRLCTVYHVVLCI